MSYNNNDDFDPLGTGIPGTVKVICSYLLLLAIKKLVPCFIGNFFLAHKLLW